MIYLLDTCVVSDLARGDTSTLAHLTELTPEDLALSAVTEMEIRYGLRVNPSIAARVEAVLNSIFGSVKVLAFDSASAQRTALLRAALKIGGNPIGAYDALIAGTALVHGLILVTSNVREFERVEGLKVENWRE